MSGYHASLTEKLRNITIRNRERIDELFRQALEANKRPKPTTNRRKS
jgi:hypothetical protein